MKLFFMVVFLAALWICLVVFVPDDQAVIAGLLLNGFRIDASETGEWRCNSCDRMQNAGRVLVYFPDGCNIHDAPANVFQKLKLYRGNGSFSGWCLDCARKFSVPSPDRRKASGITIPPGGTFRFSVPLRIDPDSTPDGRTRS